jgi:polysaccharide pyruvyl transferase WcaK-like protein
MRSVLVTGFFGEGNLGDEAILEGISRALPSGFSLWVTSGAQPGPIPGRHLPRRGISSWLPYLSALKRCSKVVFSGGILQDWSWDGVLFFALRLMAARRLGRLPAVFGAGLGPLRTPAGRAIAAAALQPPVCLWWRDRSAMALARELSSAPSHLGTDWSWNIPAALSSASSAQSAGHIGINLRPWPEPHFADMVTSRLRQWERSPTPHPAIVGIAARTEDSRCFHRVFPHIPVFQPAAFGDLLGFAEGLTEGWAMRYHVVLGMLRAGIPVMALPYDPKVTHLCLEPGIFPIPSAWLPGRSSPVAPPASLLQASPAFHHSALTRLAEMKQAFQEYLS